MKINETEIPDLLIIEPKVFADDRGYFYESYNKKIWEQHNIFFDFVQDNQSLSSYGTVRGLHYQLSPFAQTKLVRVLSGKILDVAVDIRENSPAFGKSFSVELSAENKKQLLVPRGFAHGFSVLSEKATVFYKCDNFYNREMERGINFNDPQLEIDWRIQKEHTILSAKDLANPGFKDAEMNFIYGKI